MPHQKISEIPARTELSRKETLSIIFSLLVASLLTALDLYEDRLEGVSWAHLATEGTIFFSTSAVVIYLWIRLNRQARIATGKLKADLNLALQEASRWKSETQTILAGLGEAISEQFSRWNLTQAEKDVGLLLLKGFSHKEIAELRNTSERTVRQQAAIVYQKAGLEGRAQLSAFFLEDLLLPSENIPTGI